MCVCFGLVLTTDLSPNLILFFFSLQALVCYLFFSFIFLQSFLIHIYFFCVCPVLNLLHTYSISFTRQPKDILRIRIFNIPVTERYSPNQDFQHSRH